MIMVAVTVLMEMIMVRVFAMVFFAYCYTSL